MYIWWMKKVSPTDCRSFAGEKTPAKASFLLTLKEDQQGRKCFLGSGKALIERQ